MSKKRKSTKRPGRSAAAMKALRREHRLGEFAPKKRGSGPKKRRAAPRSTAAAGFPSYLRLTA